MAALSFGEIVKPFYSGDLVGQKRFNRVTQKIKNKDLFQLVTGEYAVLDYATPLSKRAFETGDLNALSDAVAGQRKIPFKIVAEHPNDPEGLKPQLIPISRLEKTAEFGGGSSEKVADPHELMTAALILQNGFSNTIVPKEKYGTLKKADEHITQLKSIAGAVKGPNKNKIITAFEGDYANYARAVSAANGFLKAMNNGSKVKEVFLTGAQWEKEIAKYNVNRHELFGNKNYNSSDIVVRIQTARSEKKVIGISLKKKPTRSAKDPTVINKTVTGENGLFNALVKRQNMPALEKHLGKLYFARAQFFFNVIKATLYPPDLTKNGQEKTRRDAMKELGIKDGEKEREKYMKKHNVAGTKPAQLKKYQEQADVVQEKVIQENIKEYLEKIEKYITKNFQISKLMTKEAAKIGNQKIKDSLFGRFPSYQPVRNIYFATLDSILRLGDVSEMICLGLLNIIFKLDLMDTIKKKKLNQNESFHFTLITGIGNLAGGGTRIDVDVPSVYPESITTPIILNLINEKNRELEIRPRAGYVQPHKGGTSASLKYEIFINGHNIVDMEVRYKGEITPEPQFQAIITSKFAQMVKSSGIADPRY